MALLFPIRNANNLRIQIELRLEIITLDIADSAAQINLNVNKCDSHDPLNPLQFSPDFYCFIVAVIRLHWFHLLAMHSINNLTFDAPSYTSHFTLFFSGWGECFCHSFRWMSFIVDLNASINQPAVKSYQCTQTHPLMHISGKKCVQFSIRRMMQRID